MKVRIINFTPEPEKLIYSTAKICFGKSDEFDYSPSKDEINEFIKRLYFRGHLSVFEHAVFTFEISGISRACSHQLVRHRIASYTQESQRYVFNGYFDVEDYVIPDRIKEKEVKEKFIEKLKEIHEFYKDLVTLYGLPIEDARYILPNALTTKIIMTMNARELIHFIKLRTCRRAQTEIRELAFEIKKELSNILEIFKIVSPDCENCLDDCR